MDGNADTRAMLDRVLFLNRAHSDATKTGLMDNQRWVDENMSRLKRRDIEATFRYVKMYHPLGGMSFRLQDDRIQNTTLLMSLQLDALAKYADAVTICCYEELGFREAPEKISSATDLGNRAYIAINHSEERIRNENVEYIRKWRENVQPSCVIT